MSKPGIYASAQVENYGYSAEELRIFRALAVAQSNDDDKTVSELVLEMSRKGIDKSRYNRFVAEIKANEEKINEGRAKIADYDAQIAAHKQNISAHEQAADQKMEAYAPGYVSALDKAVNRQGAHAANNSRDNAAQPKKKKSGSNCTIV